jgi:predicted ribosomally synthesized peptide with SipW-like signal peptide
MTDDFELSRRKALAALGTIGVASAGAGLGTSAYFSDQETFENNSLTAGELDMHIGWESHYSDWSPDEDDGLEGDVTMGNDQPVGLPTQNSSLISVANTSDAQQFLNNTEVDQFPNGTTTFDDAAEMNGCDVLADGADESPVIVDLEDVKPGDFGEVTFSFALCDNPGFVWMNGGLVEARENGLTEPEADDPDEDGPADEVSDDVETSQVELLDEVRTALWYDDGDNLQEGDGTVTGGAADVVIVADGSGSVTNDSTKFQALQDGAEALVDAVGSNVNVGFVPFSNSASVVSSLTDSKSTTKTEIQDDSNYPGGGTSIGDGIDTGQNHLTGPAGRSGVDKVLVVLTNGVSSSGRSESTAAKDAGTTIYGIAYGDGADQNLIEDISSPPKTDDGSIDDQDEFAFIADQTDISSVFSGIGGQISVGGETVFFEGSLREALMALDPDTAADRNQGIPLAGDISAEAGGGTGRNCFSGGGLVHSVGFAWWLPTNHGNEIQGDSVSFDLGFYTEQCRHNDGEGMNNAGVAVNQTDDDAT